MGALWPIGQVLVLLSAAAQPATDADRLMKEAERLAWLRAWTRAAPLYEKAEELFAADGDRRNTLYAEISRLRGELPRLAVPEVSQRLAEYLDDPLVQRDKQLRLRCLIIKGETDTDLDPSLAEQSWREALTLAKELRESGWANRADGELGILAFLQGDVSASVIRLGTGATSVPVRSVSRGDSATSPATISAADAMASRIRGIAASYRVGFLGGIDHSPLDPVCPTQWSSFPELAITTDRDHPRPVPPSLTKRAPTSSVPRPPRLPSGR